MCSQDLQLPQSQSKYAEMSRGLKVKITVKTRQT